MEVAKALGGSFSYASAKNCKGDDSTAQGNIEEWGHTNKSKRTNEHTKHKPRLNTQKALGPTGGFTYVPTPFDTA